LVAVGSGGFSESDDEQYGSEGTTDRFLELPITSTPRTVPTAGTETALPPT